MSVIYIGILFSHQVGYTIGTIDFYIYIFSFFLGGGGGGGERIHHGIHV